MIRESIVAALQHAGVRDVPQKIADGMTVQTLIRHLETAEARRTGEEPRWQREMREVSNAAGA